MKLELEVTDICHSADSHIMFQLVLGKVSDNTLRFQLLRPATRSPLATLQLQFCSPSWKVEQRGELCKLVRNQPWNGQGSVTMSHVSR
jgi:hypothetical protein